MTREDPAGTPDQDVHALVAHYEQWASETETWARTLEAQLQQSQAEAAKLRTELTRMKRSLSWRVTAPLRGLSLIVRTVGKRTVSAGAAPAARGVLDRALSLARENDALRIWLRAALHRVPWVEERLQTYVAGRSEEESDE